MSVKVTSVATIQDVNKYISDRYGNIRKAKKELGISSSARVRGYVAGVLGDQDLRSRYEQRAETSANIARGNAVGTPDTTVRTRSAEGKVTLRNVSADNRAQARQAVAERVVSDLNASANRINKERVVSDQRSFTMLGTSLREVPNPRLVGVYQGAEQESLKNRPYSPQKLSSEMVRSDLKAFERLDTSPTISYFEGDREKRAFLVGNSPGFREELGEKGSQAFLEVETSIEGKNVLQLYRQRRENVRIIRGIYGEGEEFKGERRTQEKLLGKNIFGQVASFGRFIKQTDYSPIIRKAAGTAVTPAATVFAPFINNNKQEYAYNIVKSYGELSPEEQGLVAGGTYMVGYTAASIPGNLISPSLTQTVDVGLAIPTFVKGVVAPTPRNIAAAKIEALDIAVDYIPEVAGALVGGARGLAAGGKEGALIGAASGAALASRIPDININTNLITNSRVKTMSGFDTGRTTIVGTGGEVFVSEINIGESIIGDLYGNTTRLVDASANFVADLTFPDVNTSYRGELGFPRSNNNIFANENINDNVIANINANVNENTNFFSNINANINANVNENINVNENVNANINVNANLAANFNYNFNVDLPNFKTPVARDLYRAYARRGGEFRLVGVAATQEKALAIGRRYVESTPAVTFGVKMKGGSQFLPVSLGGFISRDYGEGTVLLEPSKKRINTFGELSGITFKRSTKRGF